MKVPEKGCILFYIYGYLLCNLGFISITGADDFGVNRIGKAFSLFSVVTFKNEECGSDSTFAGGAVRGTCYSATECSDKSGTASGNCAAGFGVCCVFISNIGTATISENRTYLQSLLWPAVETSTTAITYTIEKMQSDVCQIRLDFEHFALAGPTTTDEQGGVLATHTNCADALTTTVTSGQIVPVLCGVMTGSHIYLDVGMDATDKATLAMTFAATNPSAANAMRSWRVKTSQIPCWASYRAPHGCHQYFYGSAMGKIWSPNFRKGPATTTGTATTTAVNMQMDLMGQDLKICVRREKGMCCTLWQVCNSDPDGTLLVEAIANGALIEGTTAQVSPGWSFQIDYYPIDGGTTAATAALNIDLGAVDSDCTSDYVEIPDSTTGLKNFGAAAQVNTRYCAQRMGFVPVISAAGAFSHAPIFACQEPFVVHYHTDIYPDSLTYDAADVVKIIARGLCLDYKQEAC